jgi:hypothetical protein
MNDKLFMLHISAYSPDTIPMNRLAEYMQQLALLMGSKACVHFKSLEKGSTALCVEVEQEETPVVCKRLSEANNPNAPVDMQRYVKKLNDMLRGDNAHATLGYGSEQIILFPGCDMPKRVGPVKEPGQLEGEVFSIVGKDDTKHIRLRGHGGEEYKLTTRSIELAKEFGNRLFSLVRVSGTGTWYRNEDGKWELEDFLVQTCAPLENTSLIEAIAALRDINNDGWKNLPDPVATWRELREN